MKLSEKEASEFIEIVLNDLYSWLSFLIKTGKELPDDNELAETFYPSEKQRLRLLRFNFDNGEPAYFAYPSGSNIGTYGSSDTIIEILKDICETHVNTIRSLREMTLV